METVTIKVSKATKQRLQNLAEQSGESISSLLRTEADKLLKRRFSGSMHARASHLCGKFPLPADASTNKSYLKQYAS